MRTIILLALGSALLAVSAHAQRLPASLPPVLSTPLEYRSILPGTVAPRHKSPALAWFLSWLVPGGGQGYNDQWGKAAGFFGAALVGLGVLVSNDGSFDWRTNSATANTGYVLP